MKDRLWTKQYLLVIVTNFLLYVVYYQLMLWTTSYAMHVWKADVSEAGLATGLFIISALVARLLAGHFIDGLGRGFVLRCGTALYAASMLLYFFITSMLEFEAIRVVHGFAYGLASTAASTISRRLFRSNARVRALGISRLALQLRRPLAPFSAYGSHSMACMKRPSGSVRRWACLPLCCLCSFVHRRTA